MNWGEAAFIKLARVGAIVFLPTRNGKFLMQEETEDKPWKGDIRPPGGGKETKDKNLEQTIVREIHEEFGLPMAEVREKIKFLGYEYRKPFWGNAVFELRGHGLRPGTYQASNSPDEKVKLVEVSLDHPDYVGPKPQKLITENAKRYGDRMMKEATIAVDLDGTLAERTHKPFDPEEIGPPVKSMRRLVRLWIRRGKKVVIFTARAHDPKNIPPIKKWLKEHGMEECEVTNEKTPDIHEFYDDRAYHVVPDKGTIIKKSNHVKVAGLFQLLLQLLHRRDPKIDPQHPVQSLAELPNIFAQTTEAKNFLDALKPVGESATLAKEAAVQLVSLRELIDSTAAERSPEEQEAIEEEFERSAAEILPEFLNAFQDPHALDHLNEETSITKYCSFFTVDDLEARAREAYGQATGKQNPSIEELREWCGEELNRIADEQDRLFDKAAATQVEAPVVTPVRPPGDKGQPLAPVTPVTGPEAIGFALRNLDLGRIETDAHDVIRRKLKSKRPDAVKRLGYVQGLKASGLAPHDLLISKVPVIPPQFRPYSIVGETFVPGDANELYRDLLNTIDVHKEIHGKLGHAGSNPHKLQVYDAAKALYGFGDPVSPKTRERGVSGFLKKITGTSPKFSFFQRKLISKDVDFTGRAVIGVDPDLGLDEIGVPDDMAWKVYAPYVQRRLVRSGMSPAEAVRAIKDRHQLADRMLDAEMKERPVIYSRAPSWHKFNVISGFPKRVPGSTILINPLVTTGMTADFDGDQINIHVPSIPDAVKDAKEKLMPSKMLFSIKDPEKVVPSPKQEFILGLFNAQRRKANQVHTFPSQEEALKAIRAGKVRMSDEIQIGRPLSGADIFHRDLKRALGQA